MTPEILKEVEKVADDPVAAEKLCGKRGVEFHPLACDLVEAAKDKDLFCRHVTNAVRDERQERYDRLYKAEHPRSRTKRKAAPAPAEAVEPPEPLSIATPPPSPAQPKAEK